MVPWSREAWNKVQSVSTTSSHRVFSSLPGIASGPVALYGLMSFSSFNTPFLLTTIGLAFFSLPPIVEACIGGTRWGIMISE